MEIYPAVDVLAGQVVRLQQGDYEKVTVYSDDPVDAARRWMDSGVRLVHVVDLDGARDGTPSPELWASLTKAGIRYQVGGGLRSRQSVDQAIDSGAERVILGTAALVDPGLVGELIGQHGAPKIAVSLDIRGAKAEGAGWLDEGRDWADALDELLAVGVEVVVTTAILRDGTMQGPDTELVARVVAAAPHAEVLAAGGVGSDEDIAALEEAGAAGAVVGRALYEGRVRLG